MAILGPYVISNLNVYTGLVADGFPTGVTDSTDIIALFYVTDTSAVWEWNGTSWDLVKIGGVLVDKPALAVGPTYFDATDTYEYNAEAPPGTPLATAKWRVYRTNVGTGQVTWAGGNGNFDNAYTDLATVEAYTYS